MTQTRCPKCNGTGKIPLSDVLQATLGAVSVNGTTTAPELYKYCDWDGVGVTALNNRLEDLWKLGILERKRTHGGRGWTYYVPRRKK